MFKKLLSIFAITATLLMATSASAATFDFQSWADNNADPNYQGEMGANPISGTVDGITVDAYGHNVKTGRAYAYLDAGNAGMGVCSALSGNQCANPADDNVTANEILWLDFNEGVIIDDMDFRDANHNILAGGFFDLYNDGGLLGSYLFGSDFSALGLAGDVFGFGFNDTQFYVETMTVSAVPLPAALPLFGAALLGMAVLGRRRRNKATLA